MVTRVTGQLTDGSRGSWVIKCDPLSALLQTPTTTLRLFEILEARVSLTFARKSACQLHVIWRNIFTRFESFCDPLDLFGPERDGLC